LLLLLLLLLQLLGSDKLPQYTALPKQPGPVNMAMASSSFHLRRSSSLCSSASTHLLHCIKEKAQFT
jgi:hypothetical protein